MYVLGKALTRSNEYKDGCSHGGTMLSSRGGGGPKWVSTFITRVSHILVWEFMYLPCRFVVSGYIDVIDGEVVHMERRYVPTTGSGCRLKREM